MTKDARRSVRWGSCLLSLGCALACGAAQKEPSSADAAPAPAAQGPSAPSTAAEPPRAEAAAPAPALEAAPRTDESYGPTPKREAEDTDAAQEKKLAPGGAPNRDLRTATSAFDQALGADTLSCEGARPHRDAICEIAKRHCDLSVKTPSSSGEQDDCVTANQACEKAQRKYQARCGK